MSSEVAKIISKSVKRTENKRDRRGRPITRIIISSGTQPEIDLTANTNDDVPNGQTAQTPTEPTTVEATGEQQVEQSPTKVYYIANQDGSIASYNPTYILRKNGTTEFRIMLPDKAGTLALVEDIPSGLDGFVSKEELLNAVNTIEKENPLIGDDWTVNDLVNSYRSLLRELKRIAGWVEPVQETEP